MCRAEFPEDLINKPKDTPTDINQQIDHTYAAYSSTRIGQRLASANRVVTEEYFSREGYNWLRRTVYPIFADQTPRGAVRRWPEVIEIRLWYQGNTVNNLLGLSDSEEEFSDYSDSDSDNQPVIVFHNRHLITTISSSDSESSESDIDR